MLLPVIFLMLVNELFIVSVNTSFMKSARSRRLSPVLEGASLNLLDSIASGTQMAVEHCQSVFKWERWNCPKSTFKRQQRLLSTKETAFGKALIAAGMVHSINRNCSQGQIEGCGCKTSDKIPPPLPLDAEELKDNSANLKQIFVNDTNVFNITRENVQWVWGGCSDNPSFAADITRRILDSLEQRIDVPAYVARHNALVGIQLIKNSMLRKCRCHGISGSCTIQTCWMQVQSFEEISRKLKELYRKSVRVSYKAVEKSIIMGNSASNDYVHVKEIPGTENRLIFLDRSPDYCITNFTEGYTGTKGRMCSRNRSNVTKMEKNSCRNLCKKCGHSVKRLQKKVTRRCNCKFSWCCEVKCDTCVDVVDEHFCI